MSAPEVQVLFFGDSHTVAYNLGVRGDTSGDVLQRWRGEAATRASELHTKVVFAVGANDTTEEDGTRRMTATESAKTLAALLRQSKAAGLPTMVVGPAPVGDREQVGRIAELSACFNEVCEQAQVPL